MARITLEVHLQDLLVKLINGSPLQIAQDTCRSDRLDRLAGVVVRTCTAIKEGAGMEAVVDELLPVVVAVG